MSNASVNIKFRWGLTPSDPEQQPVLIVGQAAHLNSLSWNDIRCKLEPRVSEEAWKRGLSCVTSSPGDACELWPRAASLATLPARRSRHAAPSRCHALAKIVRGTQRSTDEFIVGDVSELCTATLATLPARRSRHAAPSRCHALAKIVRGTQRSTDEFIVLVCRKRDVYASAAAVARSFPLFGARTAAPLAAAPAPSAPRTLTVEIQLVDATQNSDSDDEDISSSIPASDTTLSSEELSTIQDLADATRLAARITDTPANIMNVDKFIEEAIAVAKELDIPEPTIIRGEELKERGMGGIYGVGAAAVCPPALVVLSYTAPAAQETVAWVGKGIVYDTGGLSIKARTSMVGMKGDCGGAAGVLGAFAVAVKAKPTVNLHAVLCLAENAVGPKATRPDDIHQLYSGRTVEINNTDAEGRLVLSDGVVYASRDLKADTIVDVATLTGAQGTATGKYHAAIVSNERGLEAQCVLAGALSGDLAHALPFAPELHFTELSSAVADMKNSVADHTSRRLAKSTLALIHTTGKYHAAIVSNERGLEQQCVLAGALSGDLAHALPFAPELHFTEFSSAVADMKNSVADRNNAQPSCAALFVLAHLGFDFRGAWLHVDMAAPAHCGERATGYGVALLPVLFGARTRSALLQALAPRAN